MFRSIKHDIFMLEVNKVALNRDDNTGASDEQFCKIAVLQRVFCWEN